MSKTVVKDAVHGNKYGNAKKNVISSSFILDCSVAMAWCFEDEVTAYSEAILDSLSEQKAIVPTIWPLEVCNVLLMAIRRKRIKKATAAAFLDRLSEFPIELANNKAISTISGIFELGDSKKITSYDASYLNLAMSRNLPLATLDKKLAKAAKSVGVKVI